MDAEATKIAAPDAMPIYNAKKTYIFDKKVASKVFADKTASLQEITCPSDVLLKQAWLLGVGGRKWTNVTYEDTDNKLNVSFDMVNCNFSAYTTNTTDYATLKPISVERALAKAKEFINTSFIKDVAGSMIGDPIVSNQYNYGTPMPLDASISARSEAAPVAPDYIDKDEFTNVTILFPYVIDGKKVYSNYGGRLWITIDVTEKWVTSYYGQLLKVPGVQKDAKPMTQIQFINYVKKGWNNPYWGDKSTVKLWTPERVYTLVQDWRNNKSTTYIASATLFPTTMLTDIYSQQNYELLVTDFRFANGNLINYPRPMY